MTGLFGSKDTDDTPSPGAYGTPDAAGASDAPQAPRAGGAEIDVERTLKELAARMSKLNTSLEGMRDERSELETKLTTFEDRLGRLGSLAETISAQYNPFLAERSPDEPDWTGNDALDRVLGEGAAPAGGASTPAGAPEVGETPMATLPDASLALGLPLNPLAPPAAPPRLDLARAPGPHERSKDLERSVILLRWVGHLVDRVGRTGLLDLLDYYENLGWLDTATKGRALKVAVGIRAPAADGDDWHGDVELHQRSLVALERLRGNDVPAARVEEMHLDLDRLFQS